MLSQKVTRMFLKRKENGGYPVNHETSSKKLHCDIQVMSSGGGGNTEFQVCENAF